MFARILIGIFLITMSCADGYYYLPYYYPNIVIPYEPENGPMRGPNSIQGHQQRRYYYNPYGAYPFTPYEPENGPMRGQIVPKDISTYINTFNPTSKDGLRH